MEPNKPKRKSIDGIRSVVKHKIKRTHIKPLVESPIPEKERSQKSSILLPIKKTHQKIQKKRKREIRKKSPIIHEFEPIDYADSLNTPRKKIFPRKFRIKTLLFVGLGTLIFILFTMLDHTTIDIIATTETQHITKKLKTQLYPSDGQLGFDIISVAIENEILLSPETEIPVQEYASGTIRIFNNYSTEPQRLVEETRLEAVGGKIFKIPKGASVIIPGKTGETPGVVDVLVYAAEPGPDYNIDLTDFSIPGFWESGLDIKYAGIYGLSTSAMTGGFVGTKKILSQQQIVQAEKNLQMNIQEALETRIKAEKTNQFFLVDGAAEISLSPVESFEEGGTVRLVQTARGSSIIISKENLDIYILETFFPETHNNELVITDYKNLYIKGIDIKGLHGITQATLEISVDISYAYLIDEQKIIEKIQSRHKDVLLPLFIEMKEVSYAHVNIFPFWRNITSDSLNHFTLDVLSS